LQASQPFDSSCQSEVPFRWHRSTRLRDDPQGIFGQFRSSFAPIKPIAADVDVSSILLMIGRQKR
jgi:hypothetical protein